MKYAYDILLNTSNECLYDFYEWNSNDKIISVKKIPIIKIDNKDFINIYNYKIKLKNTFVSKIKKETNNKKNIKNLLILTNGKMAIGINFNDRGIIESKSSLLLDEEEEILNIAETMPVETIEYQKSNSKETIDLLTRKEKEEKKFLQQEFTKVYNEKNIEKLKYLYMEYFNRKENDIKKTYTSLINSLNKFNNKHEKLYNLLKTVKSLK